MTFEKVLDGVLRYLNSEVYSGMNDWQEVLARMAVGRFVGDPEKLKTMLLNNGMVRTFGVMDSDGNVDVDGLLRDLKAQIEQKGKLSFALPVFGTFTFKPEDVDKLHQMIGEG